MTVKEIIEAYLKDHGYDGLFNSDVPCACRPGALAPCDSLRLDCEPGYLRPCDGTCDDPPCDWHIDRNKPPQDGDHPVAPVEERADPTCRAMDQILHEKDAPRTAEDVAREIGSYALTLVDTDEGEQCNYSVDKAAALITEYAEKQTAALLRAIADEAGIGIEIKEKP